MTCLHPGPSTVCSHILSRFRLNVKRRHRGSRTRRSTDPEAKVSRGASFKVNYTYRF